MGVMKVYDKLKDLLVLLWNEILFRLADLENGEYQYGHCFPGM